MPCLIASRAISWNSNATRSEVPSLRNPARGILGVAGVALLHIAIIAGLIRAIHFEAPHANAPAHEHLVWLILHPKPASSETRSSNPKNGTPPATVVYPDYRSIHLPPLTGETNPNGLGGSLFDCAPENLANLTPEQRAHCTVASIDRRDETSSLMEHPSKSKNAVRWARALQRKQNPTLLPCFPPSLQSIFCAANAISHGGFDLDAEPNYGDKPEDIHVPNAGDPPDAPPK